MKALTELLERAAKKDSQAREEIKRIESEFRNARQMVEIAGLGAALGQVLLEQRRNLSVLRDYLKQLGRLEERVSEYGLKLLFDREQLASLQQLDQAVAGLTAALPEEEAMRLHPALKTLLQSKRELLKKLLTTNEAYLRALGELEQGQQRLLDVVRAYDDYLAKTVGSGHRFEHGSYTTPKPTANHFSAALKSLLLSILAPVAPILTLLFLYWLLKQAALPPNYGAALARAIGWIVAPTYSLLLLLSLARPGGLLAAHFRWRTVNVALLRRALTLLLLIFIPVSLVTAVVSGLGEGGAPGCWSN